MKVKNCLGMLSIGAFLAGSQAMALDQTAAKKAEDLPNYCCSIQVAGPTQVKTGFFMFGGTGWAAIEEFPDDLCLEFRAEKNSNGLKDYLGVSLRNYDCKSPDKWEVVFQSFVQTGTREFEFSTDRFSAKLHCKQMDGECGLP